MLLGQGISDSTSLFCRHPGASLALDCGWARAPATIASEMHPLRRFFALLSLLSLLQLTLLASGTPCVAGTDGATDRRMSSTEMAGMNGHSTHPRCDASGTPSDCGLPWSTGQCTAMTTCMLTVAFPPPVMALAAATHRAPALPEPGRILSRDTAAPELPPPRA
jgi:hypothetical protein